VVVDPDRWGRSPTYGAAPVSGQEPGAPVGGRRGVWVPRANGVNRALKWLPWEQPMSRAELLLLGRLLPSQAVRHALHVLVQLPQGAAVGGPG